jgi:hypothetical protein
MSILARRLPTILIAGCSKLEIQPDPLYSSDESALKSAKKHEVPFKGQFVNWERKDYVAPDPDPPATMRAYFDGEGNATHLGKTLQFQDQQWEEGALGAKGWGTMIFTAANGDELWSTYTSSFLWEDWPVFIIPGKGEFTGGTGRFENATGSFDMEETYDYLNEMGTGIYTGTIKY